MATRKNWSNTIEEHGISVRIFEKVKIGGVLYREVQGFSGKPDSKDRKSLGHRNKILAVEQARALARELAKADLTGMSPRDLTLGRLFAAYRQHRLPLLKPYRQRYAHTFMAMLEQAWGADLDVEDIDQDQVDSYVRKRRSLEIVPPPLRPDEQGNLRRGGRKPTPPRDGTLDGDFRWLSSVFNWARKKKSNKRRLLLANPLHDVTWPKEQNIRRPVARHERFLATLGYVDDVDPEGRLRCILNLARCTGRRESAICHLRASDLLLSEDRVLEALDLAGMDEALADHMPHGAIRWGDEQDKMGLLFISPINVQARRALDSYNARKPRVGDVPLFPSPGQPRRACRPPYSRQLAYTGRGAGGATKAEPRHLPSVSQTVGE